MFLLYNVLVAVLAPLWLPWMWLRARRRADPPNWAERFGNYPFKSGKGVKRVWFHAVSVGEVIAAKPILRAVKEGLPDHEIVLSVTTSSGHKTAEDQAVGLYDHLVYFPVDVLRYQMAAMTRVRPSVVAIMETELWLNFLWIAKQLGARTLLVNGRISDRNFSKSKHLAFFYRSLFRLVDRVLAQSEEDRERLVALGAKGVEVFGNSKFDQALEGLDGDASELRKELGLPPNRKVIVIGSTRDEEEERLVIEAVRQLGAGSVSVIHAPRHVERGEAIAERAAKVLGGAARRSLGETGDYLVLDTYGELAKAYALADVVVVGGGFSDLGGQNIIQPLALGKPVLHGPHMQNFREAADAAQQAGATRVCADSDVLASEMRRLLADEAERKRMGEAASRLIRASAGAGKRYAEAIIQEAIAVEKGLKK